VGSNIKNVEELAHYPALGKIEQSYCPRKLSRERTPIWPHVGGLRLAVSFLFISRYFLSRYPSSYHISKNVEELALYPALGKIEQSWEMTPKEIYLSRESSTLSPQRAREPRSLSK